MISVINGSPNANQNSGFLAKKAMDYINKSGGNAEIIDIVEVLKDVEFPFCTACASPCPQACEKSSKKLKKAFDLIRKSSGMVIISPVYFGTVTGELKAFWDMARHLRNEKAMYNMVGGAVGVGASRFGGEETTIRTIHDMMLIQGMIIVGNSDSEKIGHQGVCMQKPAEEDKEGLASLERLCNRILEVSKAIDGGVN